jgi:hypothetical protein
MRKLLCGFGLCVALGIATPLLAQSPDPSVYEKDGAMSSGKPLTVAQQRIFERASFEAHERLARIESRHRKGISAARPAVYSGGVIIPDSTLAGHWHFPYEYPYLCP